MNRKLHTLFTCCAAGALAASLAACEPEDPRKTASTQMALADSGYEPGWSMTDLAGVDPAFYRDDSGALPQALPMKPSYAGNYGEAAGYGYAPAYDYAPDRADSHYEPLDESYYYDEGYDDGGYVQDAYYEDGYHGGDRYSAGGYDLAGDSNDYALLALAVALAGMLGDAPPDYGFAYDGVSPWAWQTGDRYFRYAEPVHDGYRYYYYEPDAYRPFLVSDPYYSYGYRGDRLVVIYDSAGRRVDARRAKHQLRAAKAYYARAERLHRAAERDRFGVSAPLWERHRERISRDRNDWQSVRAERPSWKRWEARNAPRLYRQWSSEALVRRDAERSFAKWQRADYRTPAPALYTREARREQVRNLAELRRERAEELAERRRARAEQQIERQGEARRIAERTDRAAELRRERASRLADRREASAERRQQIERRDGREAASERLRPERAVQLREAREQRQQASARRDDNRASAHLIEQRRERQQAAAERRENQRTAAQQRRNERAAASAAVERERKIAAAREARRRDTSRARAEDRQGELRERRAQQHEQQARREAQQRERQARREQVQVETARQRAQAAAADRQAQREQARRETETRGTRQAEARQAQAQAQREARQAQRAQARVTRQEPARQVAQARQERQDARDERREQRRQRRNRD